MNIEDCTVLPEKISVRLKSRKNGNKQDNNISNKEKLFCGFTKEQAQFLKSKIMTFDRIKILLNVK